MTEKNIRLPAPKKKGPVSVEEALSKRRSTRSFSDQRLALWHVAQLLWAGQGTAPGGRRRTAPSAGAIYPAYLFLVTGEDCVDGLEAGIYGYESSTHSLSLLIEGDLRDALARAALNQDFLAEAPVDMVITAEYSKTTARYGKRGMRYVDLEVGHIAENLHLQAQALGMGTVVVGAFVDNAVADVLSLPANIAPVAIMPFGFPDSFLKGERI